MVAHVDGSLAMTSILPSELAAYRRRDACPRRYDHKISTAPSIPFFTLANVHYAGISPDAVALFELMRLALRRHACPRLFNLLSD